MDLVEAFCRNLAGVVGTASILVTVFVQKLGRDKFIEYITNYDNYGVLVGVGGAFLFMFAYYSPKDVWSGPASHVYRPAFWAEACWRLRGWPRALAGERCSEPDRPLKANARSRTKWLVSLALPRNGCSARAPLCYWPS